MAVAYVAAVESSATLPITVNGTTTVTVSVTPTTGELLVLKIGTGDGKVTVTGVSDNRGNAWTRRVGAVQANYATAYIYTATASTSTATTISVTVSNSSTTSGNYPVILCVERWSGAQVGTANNYAFGAARTTTTSSITTSTANATVTWMTSDWWAVTTGTPTYAGGATATGAAYRPSTGCFYFARVAKATPGAQTYGMTAPTGQTDTNAAIELVPYVAPVNNPKLSTLVTDFTTMPAFFDGNFGGVSIVNGQGNVPTTSGYAAFATNGANQRYSFVEDTIFLQVPQVSGTQASWQNSLMVAVDGANSIEMAMDGGTFKGRVTRGGTTYDVALGAYDPTAHAWWRIREGNGPVYFDASPDGVTWTNLGSQTHQLDLSAVDLKLQAGHWNTADADGPAAIYDNLNYVPPPPITPVALDAVGAGTAAGDGTAAVHTIDWPHTIGGDAQEALLVGVSAGTANNSQQTGLTGLTVTCGGVAMTQLGRVASDNQTTAASGWIYLFGLLAPPAGAQTITVTANGTDPFSMVGGSVSFASVSAFGAVTTGYGYTASASVAVTGTSTDNMVATVFGAGSGLATNPTTGTKAWLDNFSTGTGAGNAAMSTVASAAGPVTPTWGITASDWWGAVAVELIAGTSGGGGDGGGDGGGGTPPSTGISWHPDYTQADVVAAGYWDSGSQRENGAGVFNDPTVPFPFPITTAPYGRPGRAIEFSIPNNYIRAETEPPQEINAFDEGDDYFFGFAFALAPGFPLTGTAYQVIEQLHGAAGSGSPPVAFEARQDGLRLTGGWGKPKPDGTNWGGTYSYDQQLLATLQTGRWYNVVYRVHFSDDPATSQVDVWIDGAQVVTAFHPPCATVYSVATIGTDGGPSYLKMGIYHDPSYAAATVWHTADAIDSSYAAVDPTPAGGGPATYQGAASSVSGTVAKAAGVRAVPIPTTPQEGTDALQRRTLTEVRLWEQWLLDNSATGFVGEFATPSLYAEWGDPDQQDQWNALLGIVLGEFDRAGLHSTMWAAGPTWDAGYPLAIYKTSGVGTPLVSGNGTAPTLAGHPSRNDRRHGLNLSGLETGVGTAGGSAVRTTAGYVPAASDFALLAGDGIDTVRLPLAWERLQPTLNAALDTTALATLDSVLANARANGVGVILDPQHNYGRYTAANGTVMVLGGSLTAAHMVDFWTRLVAWLGADPARSSTVVMLDLHNEPHDAVGGVATWKDAAQQTVTAIRNAGDTHRIAVAGYQWSSLTDWPSVHGSWSISDPAQNFVFEAHWYWDTQTDPSVGGPRSGQFQQSDGAGGVETLTYATELAAAIEQTGGGASAVTGSVATLGGTRITGMTASAVSGTRAQATVSGEFPAVPAPVVSGTTAGLAEPTRTIHETASAVSGTRAALAPSWPVTASSVSGTVVRGDGWKHTDATATVVSGTIASLLEPGKIPPSTGRAISGTVVTTAEVRESVLHATARSGTIATGDGVRETAEPVTSAISGTVARAGTLVERNLAAEAVSGTVVSTPEESATMRVAASSRSGTVAGLLPAGMQRSVTGTVVTAAPTMYGQAAGVSRTGTVARSGVPSAEEQVGARAVSGTRADSAPATTIGPLVAVAISGTVTHAGATRVKIGNAEVVTGTVVTTWVAVGIDISVHVVTGTIAMVRASEPYKPVFVRPAGPVRPQVPHPRKRLLVVETITGRKVAELPFTALSWNSTLNDIGKCSATVPLEAAFDTVRAQGVPDPRAMLRAVLTGPYRFSLVPCYGTAALMGGPLQPSSDIAGDRVAIAANGLEKLLDKRILSRPTGTGTWADPSRDVVVGPTNVRYAMLSVVGEAITDYYGDGSRALPITCNFPPPDQGQENFTWASYDLVRASKALDDLATRPDGPDWRLEPYIVEQDDGEYVYWDLQIGDPYLPASGNVGPEGPLPWTFTPATASITHTIDVTGMASTYYATGDGQDREKTIARADDGTLTTLGFPALEELDSSTSTTDTNSSGDLLAEVQSRADALVAAHYSPTDTWSVEFPADGSPNVGLVRRGDVARIEVRDKLYAEPGYHLRRITDVAGGDGRTATVTCDLDDDLVGV